MIFTRDIKPATPSEIVWELKQLLVAAGWTVTSSSDGTTYSSSADVLTTAADLDNDLSWFVVQSPAGKAWCFQLENATTDPTDWRVKYSRAAGFIIGSPSATQVPSASDQVIMLGGGSDAVPTFATLFDAAGTQNVAIGAHDGGLYGWYLIGYEDGLKPQTFIFYDPLLPGSYPSEDTDPFVFAARYSTVNRPCSLDGLQQTGTTNVPLALYNTTVRYTQAMSWEGTNVAFPAGYSHPNAWNGNADTAPVHWVSTALTPNGWKGTSSLFRWHGGSESTGARTNSPTAANRLVVFEDLLVPWDGGDAPANALSTATFTSNFFAAGATYLDSVSADPADGASLGATFDEGRWTPIVLALDPASDTPVLVWAKMSANAYAWQVVYQQGVGFAPLFDTSSTESVVDGVLRLSILPLGGWTSAPELYVGLFAEAV